MKHATRILSLLLALIAVAGLAACGSDDETTTTVTAAGNGEATTQEESKKPAEPALPTIVIRNGEPVGGVQELEFDAGDEIRFRVSSNQADEVHVHGYDEEEEIPAGGSATLAFPADIEGIFEVELHHSETQIAELRVNP